jgi:hypothetical protein
MPPPPPASPPRPPYLLPPERVTFDSPPPMSSRWPSSVRRRASRLFPEVPVENWQVSPEAINETRERLRALRRRFDSQLREDGHIEESNVRRRRRLPEGIADDGQPESSSSRRVDFLRHASGRTRPPRDFERNQSHSYRGEVHNAMRRRLGVFLHNAANPSSNEEDASDTRQSKKRKLTHETPFQPHLYGWKGQVDPAHLRLEIASYDGGHWSSDDKYRVENLLKKDTNVYCSNSASCHILFQHQAGTTFHLDHLVVKAPRTDYTAP